MATRLTLALVMPHASASLRVWDMPSLVSITPFGRPVVPEV